MLDAVSPSLRLPNFAPSVGDNLAWSPDRYLWSYGFGDGEPIASLISLLRNGGISNCPAADVHSWSLERNVLKLHRRDGSVGAMLSRPRHDNGRLILDGLSQDDRRGTRSVQLRSRMCYGTTPAGERTLCVESTIRCPSRTLLVVFNSGGRVFDGTHTPQYDFYALSDQLSVDVMRFAEHEGMFARFLDKTGLVLRHIETMLRFGYRKLILLGLSAAGYVSIHMANLLAQRLPELSVSSVVANPQLRLDDEEERVLIERVDNSMLSPIWSGSLDHVDFDYRGIDERLRRDGQTGARHVVIYDRGNPGEAYHSEYLAGLPGVELVGVDLGMSHAAGVYELCRRELVVDGVKRMMAA